MKSNFIHVCFVIDESGSMYRSINDVVNGFNDMILEQKQNNTGSCAISLYKFNDVVSEVYVGKDVNEVKELTHSDYTKLLSNVKNPLLSKVKSLLPFGSNDDEALEIVRNNECIYSPNGCTAMNDGIGTAIDNIGKWLADMPEEERPEKNLIVIMTDGMENASHKYSLDEVKEKIKHQTEVYSWTFSYIGTDITSSEEADKLGINLKAYNTRDDISSSYKMLSSVTTKYRNLDSDMSVDAKNNFFLADYSVGCAEANAVYKEKTGIDIN